MTCVRRAWKWLQAYFRLSDEAVCEMSVGKGLVDFHDYPDSDPPEPWHFHVHRCRRCKKDFTI